MRILLVADRSRMSDTSLNAFVPVMVHGLEHQGNTVVCDNRELWTNHRAYDLVFFQFPTEIGGGGKLSLCSTS